MKARKVKGLDPQAPLAANAARIVKVRLDELRGFAPVALDEERTVEQHDMRIAAKRLRYILETTEFCFGPSGEEARRRAKELQGILGDLHDCDEMIPRIEQHLTDLRVAHPGVSARGVQLLGERTLDRRRGLFQRFREFWDGQERAGTWDELERAADEARLARQEAGG